MRSDQDRDVALVSPRSTRPLAGATAVLAAIATCALLVRAALAMVARLRGHPWDGVVDWASARSFWAGENPYAAATIVKNGLGGWGGIGHPPTTAFWFLPFARLELGSLSQALALVVVFLLSVHLVLVCTELRLARPLLVSSLLFALVLSTPWFIDHLEVAQISELIAFAYVLAWFDLRRGQEVRAGVVLGLATTLKLFPALLVLYLLVTRRLRAFAAACASFAAVALVMTARFGWASWPLFFSQQAEIARRWTGHIRNGSLHGVVLRLATRGCAVQVPTRPDVSVAVTGLSLALIAAALWFERRARGAPGAFDLSFALLCTLSAFLNPWTWEHYDVLLILPLLIVAVAVRRALAARPVSPAVLAAAAALVVAVAAQLLVAFSDIRAREALAGRAAQLSTREHLHLHLLEVANWIAWPLTVALCAALLKSRTRLSFAALPE
jgi:alpha-1,2-mannosyltransferase